MRFKHHLNEIADTNVKVKVIKDTKDIFMTKFEDKDGEFYFFDAVSIDWDDGEHYELEFYRDDNRTDGKDAFDIKNSKSYVSNIISGVVKSLKMLLDKRNVSMFKFTAEYKELIPVYDKAIKLIEKKFPNYKLLMRRKSGPFMMYKFERR